MAKQDLVAQKAVGLVDVEIVARLGVKAEGEGDLVAVFRQMCLDVAIGMLAHQLAGHLHLLGRRGDGKARGDGIALAPGAMPFFDQRLAVVIA